MRVFHRCWTEFLDGREEGTPSDTLILPWSDGVNNLKRIFVGSLLGDQHC